MAGRPVIPEAAVEAAAKALYVFLDEDHRGGPPPWESLAEDDETRRDAVRVAVVALEAAWPSIAVAAHWSAENEAANAEAANEWAK